MFPTVEVRWFYKGTVPPEVTAWFEQTGREPSELAERTDYYLRQVKRDALGIKLREGRIEIKQKQQKLGVSCFHERVTGKVGRWRKWSFALAGNVENLDETLVPTGSWVGVQKRRKLRRYCLAGDQRHEIESGATWPFQGCNFELTELGVEGSTWWSISLEAFGIESTLQQSLALVAGHVMTSHQPPILDLGHSYGYPRWLEGFRE